MSERLTSLSVLRRRFGNGRQFLKDSVFGITRSIVFESPCDHDAFVAPPGDLSFRFGSAADLSRLSQDLHEYGAEEKQFGFERLRQGDSLVLGESAGEVMFYAWLMYGQMEVDEGMFVPLAGDVAYSYKVFTVARARGLRICSAYYSHIRRLLHAQGRDRLICRVTIGNISSIRAHMRTGFQPAGRLWKLVLGHQRLYRADVAMRAWLPTVCPSGYFSARGFLLGHKA